MKNNNDRDDRTKQLMKNTWSTTIIVTTSATTACCFGIVAFACFDFLLIWGRHFERSGITARHQQQDAYLGIKWMIYNHDVHIFSWRISSWTSLRQRCVVFVFFFWRGGGRESGGVGSREGILPSYCLFWIHLSQWHWKRPGIYWVMLVRCSIMEAFSWVCDFSWLFVLDVILQQLGPSWLTYITCFADREKGFLMFFSCCQCCHSIDQADQNGSDETRTGRAAKQDFDCWRTEHPNLPLAHCFSTFATLLVNATVNSS